jgi:amidase
VLDSALFMDVVAGGSRGDAAVAKPLDGPLVGAAARPPQRLRVATSFRGIIPARIDPQNRRAVDETAALLRSMGHVVEKRNPAYGTISNTFLPRFLRGIRDDAVEMPRPERLERRTRGFAHLGALVPAGLVAKARAAEARHADRVNALFDDYDVLMTPTTAQPPVEVLRWEGLGATRTLLGMGMVYPFTAVWNTTGQPAAAVPAGFTSDGLPLSVQLVGRPNDEATLISLAAQIEAEQPWAERRPPVA